MNEGKSFDNNNVPEIPEDLNAGSNESGIADTLERLKAMSADGSLAKLGVTAEFNPEDPESITEVRSQLSELAQKKMQKGVKRSSGLMTNIGSDHTMRNMGIGLSLFILGSGGVGLRNAYEDYNKIEQEMNSDDSIDVGREYSMIYDLVSKWKAKRPEVTHIQLASARALKGKFKDGDGGGYFGIQGDDDSSFNAYEVNMIIGRKSDAPVVLRVKSAEGQVISDAEEEAMRQRGEVKIKEEWHDVDINGEEFGYMPKYYMLMHALDVYDKTYPSEQSS
ncbi:MAG: hypothetical protein WC693_02940 [Patescibacteria group bacterium]|jgi:hypothetical protein